MSSQGNSKPYLTHTYPDVSIDLKRHNVNVSKIRNYVYSTGVTMTVRTVDEKKARLEPSPHRLTNIMYYCNNFSTHGVYLDED